MKDQIVSISLSRSTTCSLSSFHNGILDLIEKTTPAALHIESQFPAYKTAVGTLASIVRRRTAFVSTQMLQEADQRYEEIVRIVNAYAIVSPTEAIRDFIVSANGHIAVYKRIMGGSSGVTGSGSDLPTEPEQPTDPGLGDSPDEI